MADWRARLTWRARALVRPPVSLGVRCAVIDSARRVLLVRHTYTGGWHLPGGAVDPGEPARAAAVREVGEETGVAVEGTPTLLGLYWNRALAGRDHVACFVVRDHPPFDQGALRPKAMEIAAVVAAPVDALPEDTTGPTRRRLGEILWGTAPDELW